MLKKLVDISVGKHSTANLRQVDRSSSVQPPDRMAMDKTMMLQQL